MKKIIFFVLAVFVIFVQNSYSLPQLIKPGIIIDDSIEMSEPFISSLKKEIKALLSEDIEFKDKFILSSNWSSEKAEANYKLLLNSKEINFIISIGVLSSAVVSSQKNFEKPVMAVGIIDPVIQGIDVSKENKSGIKNFTYILYNQNLEGDIKTFYRVYPFKKLALIAENEIADSVLKNINKLKNSAKSFGAEIDIIRLNTGINDALKQISGYDCAYLGYFGRFSHEKKNFLNSLSNLGITVFGSSKSDINSGAVAALYPEENLIKTVRRTALNLESYSEGKNLSDLPVKMELEKKFAINIQAASKQGFSPSFAVLSEAEIIDNQSIDKKEMLNLDNIVKQAIIKNLDLKMSALETDISNQDYKLAKSEYLPSLSLNAGETIIDKKRAENSMGTAAERTAAASVKVEQLLYSETSSSVKEVNKNYLEAQKKAFEIKKLDIINQSTTAYFNVLKAKTIEKIRKDNLDLTKKHLSISEQREIAGYSGKSDVYRWKSSVATAAKELFEASNNHRLQILNLNKILDRPFREKTYLVDESLEGELFKNYKSKKYYEYINNPATFKKFSDFLVKESLENSPEIQQLNFLYKAYSRELKRYKRERFIPVASVAGEALHTFDRSGEGSNIKGQDPEDNEWTIALNLSWPLYSKGKTNLNRKKTEINLEKLENERKNLSQNLEVNVRSSILDLLNKIMNLEASETSADYAKKSLVLVQDLYARGKVSVTELVNAQNESLSADLSHMNSVYDFLSAVFNLQRTIGRFSFFHSEQENIMFNEKMKKYIENN
ncbi:MAG: ABC transporter substrate binding protein [Desulforegulaceae bacterium]|nr:ABC transporter substrate binding protein [Desulforegulaceae bacterium]